MKNLLLLIFSVLLFVGCSSKLDENRIDKTYVLKVVFKDNHEAEIRTISNCPPKIMTQGCSDVTYLYINCDYGQKIATEVKYFSIVSEK